MSISVSTLGFREPERLLLTRDLTDEALEKGFSLDTGGDFDTGGVGFEGAMACRRFASSATLFASSAVRFTWSLYTA
jgi:hypothetical protein